MNEWMEEDKKYLNCHFSIKNLSEFMSADFVVSETKNEKIVRQSIL
jgi:hypothetical protein